VTGLLRELSHGNREAEAALVRPRRTAGFRWKQPT